jgi:hypothetical protein
MSCATPAKKISQLLDELNILAKKDHPEDISLARIEREGRSLLLSNPHSGHLVLGAVCCLRDNETQMRGHYQNAIGFAASETEKMDAYYNYSRSLQALYIFEEAFYFAEKANEIFITPKNIRAMAEIAYFQGRRGKASLLIKQWEKMTGDVFKLTSPLDQNGIVRESVMHTFDNIFEEHEELWTDIAKV